MLASMPMARLVEGTGMAVQFSKVNQWVFSSRPKLGKNTAMLSVHHMKTKRWAEAYIETLGKDIR